MSEGNSNRNTMLPFEVIVAATDGDVEAINMVLNHYQAYILLLSKRCLFDEFGNRYEYIDEEKKQMLEIQLITGILKFQADQIA